MWKQNFSKTEEETLDSWRKKYKLHVHQLPIMPPKNTDPKHGKSQGYQLPEDASGTMKDNYRRVKRPWQRRRELGNPSMVIRDSII